MTQLAMAPRKAMFWRVQDIMNYLGIKTRYNVYKLIWKGCFPGAFQVGENTSVWLVPVESVMKFKMNPSKHLGSSPFERDEEE